MTTPLLHDTDLARIAPLPDDMKRSQLMQMKGGFSPFSYKPVTTCYPDIFNVQSGMFGASPPTPWKQIQAQVIRASRLGDEQRNNLQVAKALYEFASNAGAIARRHDFFPMHIGVGKKVSFWLPMVLAVDEKPHAIFIDPRRSKGLAELGRKFVFSMMHERIRAADADFANIQLGIIRFQDGDDDERSVRFYRDEGVTLFSLEELEDMVASTYRIWLEVHEEREADARRRAAGGRGSLL
ncbi:type VI toxin-antitoxin system SocB family DNA replication inhibitor toxin [Rhizobium sp.]|uniref:type VI toxin-antitoxin system SocB family DNA replication inhibitor toxin n=1 Tax=Rhizobium sp. TaxID=391 RepID=UPI0028ABA2E2